MEFIQILEFHTSKIEKVRSMDEEWRQATEGKRTLRRSILCRDRNDANRYLVFAFFDSPTAATVNSELPETAAFASQVNAVVDRPLEHVHGLNRLMFVCVAPASAGPRRRTRAPRRGGNECRCGPGARRGRGRAAPQLAATTAWASGTAPASTAVSCRGRTPTDG